MQTDDLQVPTCPILMQFSAMGSGLIGIFLEKGHGVKSTGRDCNDM